MADDRLSLEEVAKLARLARLSVSEGEADCLCNELGAMLEYAQSLAALDLDGVRPLTHVGDEFNRLDADVPGPMLDRAAALQRAPDAHEDFYRVPKVMGDGGGA